jgi:hypothetical protein
MIKIKSKNDGQYVDVFSKNGDPIPCMGLEIRWDPDIEGLVAVLEVAYPEIELNLIEEYVRFRERTVTPLGDAIDDNGSNKPR